MCEEVADEIAALSAIYCGEDEFELLEDSADNGFMFRVKLLVHGTPLVLTFHLPREYPRCLPNISVRSEAEHLSRQQCQAIKEGMTKKAAELQPELMIHDLLSWLVDNFSVFITAPTSSTVQSQQDDQSIWVALLHLDHMRAKSKYIKTIEKFTSDLELTGRLFMGRVILIFLQGAKENIKEYMHLQKTSKVDVDSSGRRCKEKMMSVLCEAPLSEALQQLRIPTFEVKECPTLEDLREEFQAIGFIKLYEEFVPSLL